MARIRQHGTAGELVVATVLRGAGHAYRLNVRSLAGSPDFANRKRKWAIFVHGCFWHHHTGCARATTPRTNSAFWREKFQTNRKRDAGSIRSLRRAGFRIVIVWECETADREALAVRLSKILKAGCVDMREAIDH